MANFVVYRFIPVPGTHTTLKSAFTKRSILRFNSTVSSDAAAIIAVGYLRNRIQINGDVPDPPKTGREARWILNEVGLRLEQRDAD